MQKKRYKQKIIILFSKKEVKSQLKIELLYKKLFIEHIKIYCFKEEKYSKILAQSQRKEN